jgi:molybdate transport system ATP-binding protein
VTSAGRLRLEVQARVAHLVLDVTLCTAGPLVIVGPNGAGKTSLLLAVLGLLPVARGRIDVGGDTLLDTVHRIDVPVEQRRLGYVPQDYALFPQWTVWGNVAFAIDSALPAIGRKERRSRVQRALDDLGLRGLAGRSVAALSGGEKQRTALARALSIQPRALLLDEPISALDVQSRREVRGFLATYLDRLALPSLMVTHDAADARAVGDRVLVLEAGRATQLGTWDELARHPASLFVEQFVASKGADEAACDDAGVSGGSGSASLSAQARDFALASEP